MLLLCFLTLPKFFVMAAPKFTDRIILVSALSGALFLIGFVFYIKRSNRDYYIPEHYHGWVSIVHQQPGMPALEKKDGALQIVVNDSGFCFTSTPLEQGWGRNRFFRMTAKGPVQIPNVVTEGRERLLYIHRMEFYHHAHQGLIESLPAGTDTVLANGTRIVKHSDFDIQSSKGKKDVETFFLSERPLPVTFNPPPNPREISDKAFVTKQLMQ